MPVDRCICHQISFEQILKSVNERGLRTVQEIQAEKLSSTNCKLCLPYIERMLETGETSFVPGGIQQKKRGT